MRLRSAQFNTAVCALTFLLHWQPAAAQSRWSSGYRRGESSRCRDDTPVLTSDSIGPVHPYLTLRQLEAVCPELDRRLVRRIGPPSPVVYVQLGDVEVEVEITDTLPSSSVFRISSSSRALRTVDGYGPGSAVVDMANAWPVARFRTGEGVYAVIFENEPGLSFIFPWPHPMLSATAEERLFFDKDASVLTTNSVVTRVLLLP